MDAQPQIGPARAKLTQITGAVHLEMAFDRVAQTIAVVFVSFSEACLSQSHVWFGEAPFRVRWKLYDFA